MNISRKINENLYKFFFTSFEYKALMKLLTFRVSRKVYVCVKINGKVDKPLYKQQIWVFDKDKILIWIHFLCFSLSTFPFIFLRLVRFFQMYYFSI